MLRALKELNEVLTRCRADFDAMSKAGQGEEVRGYANARAVRVQAELRKYERVLGSFFSAMGIKVSPLGSRSPALAG
jgi:hypothetical protein